MSFTGIAPEMINGRLAMLGFVAAVGAEIATGQDVFTQWSERPGAIVAAGVTIIVASLVPFLRGDRNDKRVSIFSPTAEVINGRAAMVGFACLLIFEFLKHQPLFIKP